jgi:hypothetical protein
LDIVGQGSCIFRARWKTRRGPGTSWIEAAPSHFGRDVRRDPGSGPIHPWVHRDLPSRRRDARETLRGRPCQVIGAAAFRGPAHLVWQPSPACYLSSRAT